ncbi:MAG: chromosome condensation protein CrcB [Pirellula sp.]|nr:chromosome condensation protein CrcB [Pirellula sp.]
MQAVHIAIVAGAGAVGALARWGTSILVQNLLGKSWPFGTLIVNVLGCLVFGTAYEMTRHHFVEHPETRLLWLTGFCGAFTTFSTFTFDLYELHTGSGLAQAALACALHLVLGLVALVGGLALGRLF